MRIDRIVPIILTLALLLTTTWALAYEEVDDLVDIFTADRHFQAVVDGRRHFTEMYRLNEIIHWQGAKGEVGAFLTNERLLAVSTRSGQWNIQQLKVSEKKRVPDVLLASHLVVMLTDERAIGFGVHTGGFVQVRLPIGEAVVAQAARGRVAGIATSLRAFGFSSTRRGVAEIRFKRYERVESIDATYNKVTLRTSQRLMILNASDAVWRQFNL